MTRHVPFGRDWPFPLPPDLKEGLSRPRRCGWGAFRTNPRAGGKPQSHPRLMLALPICYYADGVFSSRCIERTTYRDIGA
jgi:hypothetical protein